MEFWEIAVLGTYFAVLAILSVYGLHRYQLVYLYYKNQNRNSLPKIGLLELPTVCIQIPLYNERLVVAQVIDAVCKIDYPNEKLCIQILDDSTDQTVEIAQERVAFWQAKAKPIQYLHRKQRRGYKAGALQAGLEQTPCEFIAIFDADFIPPKNFLYQTIHYFADLDVGMVQARWDHLNRNASLLTKLQALLIDAHFVMEHGGRNRAGRFFNFNGTAGIWRRCCIEDAGGWHANTLTEDLDLSYRAQLKGWKFVFDSKIVVPAELPEEIEAFRSQQHRWTKGSVQTCMKILPNVLRSKFPFSIKYEAFIHLTGGFAYFLMSVLCLLMPLAVFVRIQHSNWQGGMIFDGSIFLAASVSVLSFYAAAQRELSKKWYYCLRHFPALLGFGMAMCFNNARAALEALRRIESPFVRTPKRAASGTRMQALTIYQPTKKSKFLAYTELCAGLYMSLGVWISWINQHYIAAGFLSIFAFGFFYISCATLLPWNSLANLKKVKVLKKASTLRIKKQEIPSNLVQ